MAELREANHERAEAVRELNAEAAALEARLASTGSRLSDSDLDAAIARKEAEVAKAEARVAELTSAGVQPVDPKEKERLKDAFGKYRKMWATRRRHVMELVGNMAESMEQRPKEVMSSNGLETDEAAGVSLADCTL